ncbi:MAG: phosphate regulon sensor histidine kinase PhoR [Gammaproteobacteria bacterium]|nr:phosphate regulon sensor histidine kinase PhoR [Gammaproteobacteria bacterium]
MSISTLVRVVFLASALILVGVIFDQVLIGGIAAVLWCVVMMALHLRRSILFRSWVSRPLTPPLNNLGAYYQPATKIHATVLARRRRTHTLISAAQKYKNIANNLPDGLVILDGRMMIETVNSSAATLLGLTPVDVGKPIASLIRHPDAQVLFRSDSKDMVWADIPSPVNSDTRLELRLFRVGDQETMLMARDVSDMSRLLAVRQDFIANVSHELRTPLTVLIGYIESLQSDELDRDTLLDVVQRLDAPAQRMKSLVDDLLTLTRLESSPTPELSSLSEIDGQSLISTIVEEAQAFVTRKHRITVDASPGIPIRGVHIELHSAFLNLVTNAFRYSPEGGEVTIKWYQHDGMARFSVQDEGVGIAPQHVPRITERFYRVDPASLRVTGGTGLGLAIVKHVLKRHQSSLQVNSKLGQGSTFYCDLPINHVEEEHVEHEIA